MRPSVSSSGRARSPLRALLVLGLVAFVLLGGRGFAATIVVGEVLDQTTGSAVPGASIKIRRGGATLGEAVTRTDGRFNIALDVGASLDVQNLTLLVDHAAFENQSLPLVITSGRPDRDSYRLSLLPKVLTPCQMSTKHGGVVGYFGSDDLAENITFALTYSLVARIQTLKIPSDYQPVFVACNEARPRSPLYWSNYAKALGADVFLSGSVEEKGNQRFDVKIYVSDRFGLFTPPLPTVNKNVELLAAEAAELEPITYASILAAVANGYERDGEYGKCVEMTVAAEQLLKASNAAIEQSRERCQRQLANRGLVRGAP